jgi:hypothetical protein
VSAFDTKVDMATKSGESNQRLDDPVVLLTNVPFWNDLGVGERRGGMRPEVSTSGATAVTTLNIAW